MKLTLYYLAGSRSQRVRWMLEELGLDYELHNVDLFKGQGNTAEFLSLNPSGQLPVLKIDDDVMLESGAIVQWLADSHCDKGLSPTLDSPTRREFNQWMYFAVTNLETPAWEIMLHSKVLPKADSIQEIIPFAENSLKKVFIILDNQLSKKEYLVGNQFSAADIMVGYLLMWYPEQLSSFSHLKTYVTNLQSRSAYKRSIQN